MATGVSPGGRPINESPLSASKTDNWVARNGGLPPYIRGVARGIARKHGGAVTSRDIATAISRMKVWAAGGDNVTAPVQAAAAAALAEWEALKGKAHADLSVDGSDDILLDWAAFDAQRPKKGQQTAATGTIPGYNGPPLDQGTIDKIKQFQAENGLAVSGNLDSATVTFAHNNMSKIGASGGGGGGASSSSSAASKQAKADAKKLALEERSAAIITKHKIAADKKAAKAKIAAAKKVAAAQKKAAKAKATAAHKAQVAAAKKAATEAKAAAAAAKAAAAEAARRARPVTGTVAGNSSRGSKNNPAAVNAAAVARNRASLNLSTPESDPATVDLSTPIVSAQDGPRMSFPAGKKAAPFTAGKKRRAKVVAAKAVARKRADVGLANSATDYSMDGVREAYDKKHRAKRDAKIKARVAQGQPAYGGDIDSDHRSVREVHSNHVIVSKGYGDSAEHYKVPYDVHPTSGAVKFGAEQPVERAYVPKGKAKSMSLSASTAPDIKLGKEGSSWEHGYIPLNAAAVALKNHKHPGAAGAAHPGAVKTGGTRPKTREQFEAEYKELAYKSHAEHDAGPMGSVNAKHRQAMSDLQDEAERVLPGKDGINSTADDLDEAGRQKYLAEKSGKPSDDVFKRASEGTDYSDRRGAVLEAARAGRATYVPAGARDNRTAEIHIDGHKVGDASTIGHHVRPVNDQKRTVSKGLGQGTEKVSSVFGEKKLEAAPDFQLPEGYKGGKTPTKPAIPRAELQQRARDLGKSRLAERTAAFKPTGSVAEGRKTAAAHSSVEVKGANVHVSGKHIGEVSKYSSGGWRAERSDGAHHPGGPFKTKQEATGALVLEHHARAARGAAKTELAKRLAKGGAGNR